MLLDTATTDLTVRYGEVLCEEGFELVPMEGFVTVLPSGWVVIYGDEDLPIADQPHTMVPPGKVIRVEIRPR